ncbi:MAG TPA: hypothetical protein VKU02_25290 [Gemmataceae bacterium]|nr:hypothetical protein [Gemmataceae bacterium]
MAEGNLIPTDITAHNEPAIIVSFEAAPQKLIRDAAGFGWNLEALQQDNL